MNNTGKPALVIFYDYFYPAYKAGGPIQSLTNLAVRLHDEFNIFIITGSFDLNADKPLDNVIINSWSQTILPGGIPVTVWYAGRAQPSRSFIKTAISNINPAAVYLNGIFSLRFFIRPLLAIKKIKIVVCPRGMLQEGALAGKSFKKKLYIRTLKMSGIVKNICWHATNEEEKNDVRKMFGQQSTVTIAGNIPKPPVSTITYPGKNAGSLRLIYLSLITAKKNLLQAIQLIAETNENISLDIYGPVKDIEYWEKCMFLVKKNPLRIHYKGDVLPGDVQATFQQYDAAILLTKGENFGHALYESLSVGRPIITSTYTPWNDLPDKKSGWNLDIADIAGMRRIINSIAAMDAVMFNQYCDGAYQVAKRYYNTECDVSRYNKIFKK